MSQAEEPALAEEPGPAGEPAQLQLGLLETLQSLRGGPEGMSLVMGSKVILLTPDGGPL